jgi:formylglycine-generating enzyme required for sulfatase activity
MKYVKIPGHREQIATNLITQAEWFEVMGNNLSYFKNNPNNPVEQINYFNCLEYINKLNTMQNEYTYALPTKELWLKALGEIPKNKEVLEYAWCYENSNKSTQPVGTKKPNTLGIYDMLGNVWEWTSTFNGPHLFALGGSYVYDARNLRLSYRRNFGPSVRFNHLGARLVRTKNTKLDNILYK